MEQFYRVAKVAEILGDLSESTVWLYTRQGKLKATKLSPKVTVWKESDIREFVQSQNDALNEPKVTVLKDEYIQRCIKTAV